MIFQTGKNRLFISLLFITLLSGCKQIDVYEKNTLIPHYNWKHDYTATGTFNISDTSAPYNIYIVIRHQDAYMYNNIWLNVGLQSPGGPMYTQRIDISLASDAEGWQGTGMNDIWEVRKLISRRQMKQGTYSFSINHIMRDDPLPGIMSAGMRVKKAL
ncbi:MAG: gliding motility lipoprotein GldH [Ferruginibacter sp.]